MHFILMQKYRYCKQEEAFIAILCIRKQHVDKESVLSTGSSKSLKKASFQPEATSR